MLKIINLFILILITSVSCSVKKSFKNNLNLSKSFIDVQLKDATKQIKYLSSQNKPEIIPTSFYEGKQISWGTNWWCSGFYPGTLLYLYEYTKDQELLAEAKSKFRVLEKEKNNKSTHDLGFMLFCSFGNALRITNDSIAYKDILLRGAESLATRYREETKTIRSWDSGKNWDGQPWTYPVIIDNMMNLEFLTQVSKISGNNKFINIAITHANTTLKNAFRQDYSSYHVVDYDKNTGVVIGKKTAQGAFDESAWARGQAWALYGYTMMYRETKDQVYLNQAKGIAKFYLNHPNLPEDLIPYWDMDQNRIDENSPYYAKKDLKDASTAAIIASALIELAQYTTFKEGQYFIRKAEIMLKSLSSKPYKADYKEAGGFILKHSVGSIPHNTEIDVPLTYADYYYVEALIRYYNLLNGNSIFTTLI